MHRRRRKADEFRQGVVRQCGIFLQLHQQAAIDGIKLWDFVAPFRQ
jgi:hypothetical protein